MAAVAAMIRFCGFTWRRMSEDGGEWILHRRTFIAHRFHLSTARRLEKPRFKFTAGPLVVEWW